MAIDVNIDTNALTKFSSPYQPAFRAIIFVFDINFGSTSQLRYSSHVQTRLGSDRRQTMSDRLHASAWRGTSVVADQIDNGRKGPTVSRFLLPSS